MDDAIDSFWNARLRGGQSGTEASRSMGERHLRQLLSPLPLPRGCPPHPASRALWPQLVVSQAPSFLLTSGRPGRGCLCLPSTCPPGALVSRRRRCLSSPSPSPGHSLLSGTRWQRGCGCRRSVFFPSHLFPLNLWSLWPFLRVSCHRPLTMCLSFPGCPLRVSSCENVFGGSLEG